MARELANLFVRVGADIKDFQSKFNQIGNSTDKLNNQFGKIANTINTKTNLAVANAAQSFKLWETSAGQTASKTERLNQQLTMQRTQLDAVNQSVVAHRQAYIAAASTYGKTSVQAMQMQNSLGQAVLQQRSLGQAVQSTEGQLQRSTSVIGRMTGGLGDLSSSALSFAGKAGPMLAVTAGVAIAGGYMKAVNTSAEFNAELVRAGALAGANKQQLSQLGDSIVDVASQSALTSKEVAVASQGLIRLGFNVDQVSDSLGGIVSGAEATGEAVDLVAEVVASSINVWKLSAKDAEHVSDVLTKASNTTATSVYDMSYAFKYAGPHASALGISIEDLAAMVGELGNKGIKGEQAGTALRYAFGQLAGETKNVSSGLKKLNVDLKDNEGKMRPILDILGDMEVAMKPFTGDQKIQILSDMFGVEAAPAIMNLLDTGISKVKETSQALKESEGVAKATAAQMKDSYKGALTELNSSWEAFQINIGKSGENMMKNIAQGANSILSTFNNLYTELTHEYEKYMTDTDIQKWVDSVKAGAEQYSLINMEQFARTRQANLENQEGMLTDFINYLSVKDGQNEAATNQYVQQITDQFSKEREQFTGHQATVLGKMTEHVNAVQGVKESEKQAVLQKVQESNTEQLKRYDDLNKQRLNLLDQLKTAEGGKREELKRQILQIEEQMKNETLKLAGATNQELLNYENLLKVQKGKERAETAAKVIELANKEYKETTQKAAQTYSEKMATVRKLRAEGTAEATALADKIEQEAEREFRVSEEGARKTRDTKIENAQKAAKEVGTELDKEGKNMQSSWSRLVSWFSSNPIVMKVKKTFTENLDALMHGDLTANSSVPKSGGKSRHASGGIVSGPTNALIGEAGTEAVIPLSNKAKVKPFAQAVASAMGGIETPNTRSLNPVRVEIPVVLNGREIARASVEDMMSEIDRKEKINRRAMGYV